MTVELLSVDVERRLVAGWATRWNSPARNAGGLAFQFAPGSLYAESVVAVTRDHDASRLVGRVIEAAEHDDGLVVVARMARSRAGDEALALVDDGVLGALSVGVRGIEFELVDGDDGERRVRIVRARFLEVALSLEGRVPGATVLWSDPPPTPLLIEPASSAARLLELASEQRSAWARAKLEQRAAEAEVAERRLIAVGCPAARARQAVLAVSDPRPLAQVVASAAALGDAWQVAAATFVAAQRDDTDAVAEALRGEVRL